MPQSDHKIDSDRAWFRKKDVITAVVAAVAATTGYLGIKGEIASNRTQIDLKHGEAIAVIERFIDSEKRGNEDLIRAIESLRTDVQRLGVDAMTLRQFETWIELLRSRNPTLVIPEVPR